MLIFGGVTPSMKHQQLPKCHPPSPSPVTSKTWRPSSGRFDEPFDLVIWDRNHRGVKYLKNEETVNETYLENQRNSFFHHLRQRKLLWGSWVFRGFKLMEIFNSNDCFCRWIHLQKSTNIHRDLLGSVFCMSVEHLPRLFKESGMIFNNSANGNVKIWEGCPTIHQIHCSQAAIHSDWWKRVVDKIRVTKFWIYILKTQTHDCNFLGTGPNKLISPQLFFSWKLSGVHLLAFRKFDFPMRTSTTQWNFHACWSTFLDI